MCTSNELLAWISLASHLGVEGRSTKENTMYDHWWSTDVWQKQK